MGDAQLAILKRWGFKGNNEPCAQINNPQPVYVFRDRDGVALVITNEISDYNLLTLLHFAQVRHTEGIRLGNQQTKELLLRNLFGDA